MTVGLRTLLLHPDLTPVELFPVKTLPVEDAIVRVMEGTATMLHHYERKVLTPSRDDLFWPSVIVNKKFYKRHEAVRLKSRSLYYRDHGRCAYCEKELSPNQITCDHVIPQSKGGAHSWDNVVTACRPCNAAKDDNMPVGKWKPKWHPHEPTIYELIDKRRHFPVVVDDENWVDYLSHFKGWEGPVHLSRRAQIDPAAFQHYT